MCEGTDRSVTDVSPVMTADMAALRSKLEGLWKTVIQKAQRSGLKIEFMTGGQPGEGVELLIDELYRLSEEPPTVFLQQLVETNLGGILFVEELLGLAVGELTYRVGLDEVLDGSDAN